MHTLFGFTWGELASLTTFAVFVAGIIGWLFKTMVLSSFHDDIKELNHNFSILNKSLGHLENDMETVDKRLDEHDRRLDRHHERIKEMRRRNQT